MIQTKKGQRDKLMDSDLLITTALCHLFCCFYSFEEKDDVELND